MSHIIAKNLSMSFPVRGFSRPTKKAQDPRFTVNKRGRVTAINVLRDVSFDLQAGDRLAIIGKNGAGKSTLLKTLGGIFAIDGGSLDIEGRVQGLYNLSFGIRPEATGYRNIFLSCLLNGYSMDEIDNKMSEIAEFTELDHFLSMPVATYSAGMRMRLMFAAATAFDPQVLLMDEWLGAGDDIFRMKAQARMEELVKNAGILVLASHRKVLLQETCNKGIWIEDGLVKSYGALDEVLSLYSRDVNG